MKKQLSLILALVMILGTFTTAFAATDADAIADSSAFLKEKGILVGNMAGDLMLDENLSRQDTAILVSRLMGEYDVAKNFPTAENIPTYNDIDDPFYLPVLAWAQANKTFVGHSDARFGFDDNVTAQEYAKVLLVALGYEVGPETAKDLTWEATLPKAKDLGILKDIDTNVKNTDEITRGEMAVMTFNALSVMMKDGTKTLAEELEITMPAATKLTTEVKDTKNLKEVVVELSNAKLADADRLMDASNYKIKGVSVEKVEVVGNNVIVTVEKALIKDRSYELTIRNIETGVNGTYNFKALDNTQPTIEEVTVLGEYGIKITASEPIEDAKERNFLIDGRNVSMNVETYGRDIIITPYYNEQFSDNADTLTVKEIEDYAGYKSVEKDFDIEIVRDDVAPKVTDVVAKGNKIEVTFDKDIYNPSVKEYDGRANVGNISYRSGRQTVYATDAKKIDTNVAEYTFDQEMPRRTQVTISGVQNHSKVTMASVTQEPRIVQDNIEPEIIEKDVTTTDSTATIELKFNKAVEGDFINAAETQFRASTHFKLYEREAYRGREVSNPNITAVYKDTSADSKKDVIVVTITGLTKYTSDNDLNYVLEVENFADASSSRNIMYRDYVDFKVQAATDFRVESVAVNQRTNDAEITIKFSKSLDKLQAEEFTNYLFKPNTGSSKDVRQLEGSVYLENDGKTVTIILPEDMFRVADFDTLTILNSIKALNGDRFANSYVYDFSTGLEVGARDALNKINAEVVTAARFANVTVADFNAAGINNVTDDNIAAVRAALVAAAGGNAQNWTATQIQNAINPVIARENALNKINTAGEAGNFTNVNVADFTALGVTGVTTANLSDVRAELDANSTTGTNPNWTIADIQTHVNTVVLGDAAEVAALAKINAAATLGNFSNLTVSDFSDAGVANVTSSNLPNVIEALDAASTTGTNPNWTAMQIQNAINPAITAKAELVTAQNAVALLTQANYTVATWTDLSNAMALPATTNAEVVAKTAAINNALAGLVFDDVVTSAQFGTVGHKTVTITLTNGEFKTGTIDAADFAFTGTDQALLEAGTFVRTSENEVTVTTVIGLQGTDNDVTVKGATIAEENPQGVISVAVTTTP